LNVFSHLPDPPATIASWRSLLKPGGELLLETGDTADMDSEIHFRPFDLPDHLSFASDSIVQNILRRAGFDILCILKYPCIQFNFNFLVKEIVKILWPNKKSQLKYMFYKDYSKTDMYIHARLKS
jgi:hypothetical protein